MDPYLSVILPVHNAEAAIAKRINDLLEVLSELTSRFELLVVDRGSTDQTEEVIHELLPSYPQLGVLRLDTTQGVEAAMHSGFMRARGEVVMLYAADTPISAFEIRRLWELRDNDELIVASTEPQATRRQRLDATPHGRPVAAGHVPAQDGHPGSIQIVRRATIQRLDSAEQADIFYPRTAAFARPKTERPVGHRGRAD